MSSAAETKGFFFFMEGTECTKGNGAGRKKVAKALIIWCMIVTLVRVCVCVFGRVQKELMDLFTKFFFHLYLLHSSLPDPSAERKGADREQQLF